MGRMGAVSMKDSVDMGWVKLEQAMTWHLLSNHYPPLPSSMIPVCLKAVKNGNNGEWDKRVLLPEGILFKGKYKTAPTSDIIEAHHLESFLDCDEDCDEDEDLD